MHDKSGGQFGVEVCAFGWKQKPPTGLRFNLLQRERRHKQRHPGLPGLDGVDRLGPFAHRQDRGIVQQLLDVDAGGHFNATENRTRRNHDATGVSGGGSRKVAVDVLHRLRSRQTQFTGIEYDAVRRVRAQRLTADLNRGQVPPGGKTMVSIGQEERFPVESGLDRPDAVKARNGPNLVQAAESVLDFDLRRRGGFQLRGQRAFRIVTPKPQAARISGGQFEHPPAPGNAVGGGLLVRKDRCSAAVQQPHDSIAEGFDIFSRKAESLAVVKQGRLRVLEVLRLFGDGLRVFARYVDSWVAGTEGLKRQKYSHLEKHSRGAEVLA